MHNGEPWDMFFYRTITHMIDSYNLTYPIPACGKYKNEQPHVDRQVTLS